MLKILFEHGASVKNGAPLHFAVRGERATEIIEFLIEKGASVNELLFQNDLTSWNHFVEALPLGTPLHEAARIKNKRIFELLLQYGADPKIKDNFGQLPLLQKD